VCLLAVAWNRGFFVLTGYFALLAWVYSRSDVARAGGGGGGASAGELLAHVVCVRCQTWGRDRTLRYVGLHGVLERVCSRVRLLLWWLVKRGPVLPGWMSLAIARVARAEHGVVGNS
jgi:hypothetical protein